MVGGKCEIETDEVEFKWEITQFSKVRTRVESELTKNPTVTIQSNNFCSKLTNIKATWYLKLEYTLNDIYKIILQIFSGYSRFSVQFFILNNEQKKEKLMNDVAKLYFNKNDDYYSYPIAAKYLKDEKYIINDTLTIICNLVDYGVPITRPFPSTKDCPKSLSKDIQKLLNNDEFSDATLLVNEVEFRVHKMILSVRSPVFAAMFSQKDLKKSQNHQIVIKDTNVDAVKKFLEFIYSDKIEKLDEEKFDLWKLAEKFGMEPLKNYCEHYIHDGLNEKCVLKVLQFAAEYKIDNLLNKALNYLIKYCKSIMKNEEWKKLAETNPNLLILTLDRLAQNC